MIVCRLEHESGSSGPFGGLNPLRDELSAYTSARTTWLVEINEDCPSFNCGRDLCGCASLEELAEWLGPFLVRLEAHGFYIYAYELPFAKHARSSPQLAFDPATVLTRTKHLLHPEYDR